MLAGYPVSKDCLIQSFKILKGEVHSALEVLGDAFQERKTNLEV